MKVSAQGCKHIFYHFRRSFHGVRTIKTEYKDDIQYQIFIRLLKLMLLGLSLSSYTQQHCFQNDMNWSFWAFSLFSFSFISHQNNTFSYHQFSRPLDIFRKIPIPNKIQVCNQFNNPKLWLCVFSFILWVFSLRFVSILVLWQLLFYMTMIPSNHTTSPIIITTLIIDTIFNVKLIWYY